MTACCQPTRKRMTCCAWERACKQSVEGDTKSFQFNYIDWQHPENNAYHVTEEFVVERSGSLDIRRPDIVLFVNGIPLVVIECKRPDMKDPIGRAISQQIRNQQQDQIPRLFFLRTTSPRHLEERGQIRHGGYARQVLVGVEGELQGER